MSKLCNQCKQEKSIKCTHQIENTNYMKKIWYKLKKIENVLIVILVVIVVMIIVNYKYRADTCNKLGPSQQIGGESGFEYSLKAMLMIGELLWVILNFILWLVINFIIIIINFFRSNKLEYFKYDLNFFINFFNKKNK